MERLTTGFFLQFAERIMLLFNVFLINLYYQLSRSLCFIDATFAICLRENSGNSPWKPHRKAFEGLPFATQHGRELAALVVRPGRER